MAHCEWQENMDQATVLNVYRRSTQFPHVRLLRQYVRLTGLASQGFNENQGTLERIGTMFAEAVGEDELEGFTHALYEGDFAMDAHTRYFTERRLVPSLRHIPFPPDIDPHHVLEAARDIHFIRTADNVVEYRARRESEVGIPRYVD